jgi:DNA-binding transcriptional LysR family regulator
MRSNSPFDERVLRRLKLRELRILMTVAETGSMSKAAAQLAVSQPAVSKAIAEIEHTLGVPLLDRVPRGVEPTVYGRAVLKWAIAVFDDLRQAAREVEFLADPTAGEVRVGTIEMMNAGLLPAVIDRLSRQYPRMQFAVTTAEAAPLQYQHLRERRVDLIFGRMIVPVEPDLEAEILFEDPLVVVAGGSSKWVRRRAIDPADLINEPWCFMNYDSGVGSVIAGAFRAQGLELPRLTVRSNSPSLYYSMVQTGRFLSVAPVSTIRISGKQLGLKALPTKLSIRPAPVGIVTLKNRNINPVAKLFIDCARKLAKPLAKTQ